MRIEKVLAIKEKLLGDIVKEAREYLHDIY